MLGLLKQKCFGLNWKRFWAEERIVFGLKKMFWAELKKVLGWRENCFGLKKGQHVNWKDKKGRKKRNKREALNFSKKGALKTEPKKKKKEKRKKAETKRKEGKGGAELSRGWTERKADTEASRGWRRFFCVHFFLQIFSEKIMVNLFVLNLIFSMN